MSTKQGFLLVLVVLLLALSIILSSGCSQMGQQSGDGRVLSKADMDQIKEYCAVRTTGPKYGLEEEAYYRIDDCIEKIAKGTNGCKIILELVRKESSEKWKANLVARLPKCADSSVIEEILPFARRNKNNPDLGGIYLGALGKLSGYFPPGDYVTQTEVCFEGWELWWRRNNKVPMGNRIGAWFDSVVVSGTELSYIDFGYFVWMGELYLPSSGELTNILREVKKDYEQRVHERELIKGDKVSDEKYMSGLNRFKIWMRDNKENLIWNDTKRRFCWKEANHG